MAMEKDFSWEDDLMTKSYQRQESHLSRLSQIHGKNYGKPVAGSASERRSLEYQQNVMSEVASLCYQISLHGTKTSDGTEQILFGDLFKLNEKISNKCVGLLQRARKYRLLHFSGETLWQGADDKVVISLLRRNREIQIYFTHTKRLLPNSPVTSGNLWIDVDSERRVHYDWVTNVREVSPWSISYHVMVHEAEEEELHSPSLECAKIAGLLNYLTANEYYEPPVIFRLIRPRVEHNVSLCCPGTVDSEEYQEVTNKECVNVKEVRVEIKISLHLKLPFWIETVWQEESCPIAVNFESSQAVIETKAQVSKIEKNTTEKCSSSGVTIRRCLKIKEKSPEVYIRAQDQRKPPERAKVVRQPSPPKIRPKIKLNLAPPPDLPPPIQRVRVVIPEMPRPTIKFSTCTALYKPAQPAYEDYKKIRVRDSSHRASGSFHQ